MALAPWGQSRGWGQLVPNHSIYWSPSNNDNPTVTVYWPLFIIYSVHRTDLSPNFLAGSWRSLLPDHTSFLSPNLWVVWFCSLYPNVWLWSCLTSDLFWAPSPKSSGSSGDWMWWSDSRLIFSCTSQPRKAHIPHLSLLSAFSGICPMPSTSRLLPMPFPLSLDTLPQNPHSFLILPNLMIFPRPLHLSKPNPFWLAGPWSDCP